MAIKYFEIPEDLHLQVKHEALDLKREIRDIAKEATQDWLHKRRQSKQQDSLEKVAQHA